MRAARLPGRRRAGRLAAALCALVLMAGAPAAANGDFRGAAPPVVHVGAADQAVARSVDLSIGRSIIVELPRDAKEVFVANPKIANAVVRSTRKVFLIGMENGATSVFVMDGDGRQIAAFEVIVGRDLNALRQTLRTALPGARIEVKPAGDSILLTGLVASAAEAQQAVDIAGAFVGVSGGGAATKGAVVNSLTIKGKDQVMLRVTVAEVSRSILKQLGVDVAGSWSAPRFRLDQPFSPAARCPHRYLEHQFQGRRRLGVGDAARLRARRRLARSRRADPDGHLGRDRQVHRGRRDPASEKPGLLDRPVRAPLVPDRRRIQAVRRHADLHAARAVGEPHQHARQYGGDRARLREHASASRW